MKSKILTISTLVWGLATTQAAEDSARINVYTQNPLTNIGASVLGSFTSWNGALQLMAIASTPILIQTGADTKVHNYYARHPGYSPFTIPAIWGGYLAPLALGSGFLTYGFAADNPEPYRVGCILLQTTLLSFTYQSVLKLATGREAPSSEQYSNNHQSKQFHFGFNRGGIDWGWPSGLMMMNTSTVVALNTVYPNNRALQAAGSLWLTYAFLSNPAHEAGKLAWLSDAVAGTLMGIALGRSVGNSFSESKNNNSVTSHLSISPIIGSAQGASIQVVF